MSGDMCGVVVPPYSKKISTLMPGNMAANVVMAEGGEIERLPHDFGQMRTVHIVESCVTCCLVIVTSFPLISSSCLTTERFLLL